MSALERGVLVRARRPRGRDGGPGVTRRICSGCGHTIVRPTDAVGAVLGRDMGQHTAHHIQRGEASRWVVTTSETRPLLRAVAALLASVVAALATATEAAYRMCVNAPFTGRRGVCAGETAGGVPVSEGEITIRAFK
ncbi:hypothetical protein [Promicromonospora sp. NPDC023805]|uniref:hypothetical protein n=1 Tax=Promicromonospora sp. NPDC023805 TaxID=3154696 RepID=UPI0033E44D73